VDAAEVVAAEVAVAAAAEIAAAAAIDTKKSKRQPYYIFESIGGRAGGLTCPGRCNHTTPRPQGQLQPALRHYSKLFPE
jgi:hypothetical protein